MCQSWELEAKKIIFDLTNSTWKYYERIKYRKPRWHFIQSHFPDCECVLRNCPALWDVVNPAWYSPTLLSCCLKTCILGLFFCEGVWGLGLDIFSFPHQAGAFCVQTHCLGCETVHNSESCWEEKVEISHILVFIVFFCPPAYHREGSHYLQTILQITKALSWNIKL